MINEIIQNEVLIRGMLIGRHEGEDRTTAIICSRATSKDKPNYQYVTFFGEEKTIVDSLKICDSVCVTARAWLYRDAETKLVNPNNLRLRGTSIETTREFIRKTFAAAGVPIYGLQFKDCVRFSFSGTIVSIKKTKNNKVSILLGVSEADHKGFNIIPLLYSGKSIDDVNNALATYHKGNVISVRGFVSQKEDVVERDGKEFTERRNTYFITTFMTSKMEADFDNLEE